ncbi:hypothetical protein KK062_25670 [Fulvivirgaceae bacterium PWU5]|uniref:Uncharacterized protein n=1 Tax=Dawidia cretensis TaxID=2782350 RepID=A0AAP2GW05_9BACT|nr:hypothetical protein [Dawidia cretensis]MBT1711658.1 hypothetical protein [Dawidia cretensis]
MEFSKRRRSASPVPKGFAATFLQEVVRADMSMHDMQLAAWRHFLGSDPGGRAAGATEGMAEQRYLFLEHVSLSFYIKPLPGLPFWQRVKLSWNVLRGRKVIDGVGPQWYEVCAADDPERIAVVVEVRRSVDGKLEVTTQQNALS